MGLFQKSSADHPRPMHGYNFTERTRAVLGRARDEAVALGHEYVGTEHILLALAADPDGVSAAVLANLGVDAEQLREQTLAIVKPASRPGGTGPDLPYTSRTKKVLELSMAEAHELQHAYVGTEHLLLGLLREEHGIGAQVLTHAGITLDAARAETLRLLGNSATDAGAAPQRRPVPGATARTTAVAHEAQAWQRLTHALDVTARLGGTPSVTLEADGSLTVALGPDLLISVVLPPEVRVRPRAD